MGSIQFDFSPPSLQERAYAVFVLVGVSEKGPQALDLTFAETIQIEGGEKPALVAEWINRRYFGEGT